MASSQETDVVPEWRVMAPFVALVVSVVIFTLFGFSFHAGPVVGTVIFAVSAAIAVSARFLARGVTPIRVIILNLAAVLSVGPLVGSVLALIFG